MKHCGVPAVDENKTVSDELAAALLSKLTGEFVPHDPALEESARSTMTRMEPEKLLLKIISLCGEPATPRRSYLCAAAYSRLGEKYAEETIRCAEHYLKSNGWKELEERAWTENGISVRGADAYRASLFCALAAARETKDDLKGAYSALLKAYALEPYRGDYLAKAADLLAKLRGKREALDFLLEQKNSRYFKPVRYTDAFGNQQRNESFRKLLDLESEKLRKAKD